MNQTTSNPYPYTSDNKRYQTFSWWLKQTYHQKVAKIPINAGFTCPNRDGSKGVGGCSFCSSSGSGDTILESASSLQVQYEANLQRARKKWPDCLGMAYFQSYTNTYAPLEKLREIYTPFYNRDDIVSICIATRPDCLDEEKVAWFASQSKETWIEIGLQTVNEKTAAAMNRGHDLQSVKDAIELCRKYGLKVCLHIINGLPGDSREDMMNTARFVADLNPAAIKIHMLHLLKGTRLGKAYELSPFHLMDMDEYTDLVCDQLEILPPEMIIERVSGDGIVSDLIAPMWTVKKTMVANTIDKKLFARNSWQGKFYQKDSK